MEDFLTAYAKKKGNYYLKLLEKIEFVDEGDLQASVWQMMDPKPPDYKNVGTVEAEYLSSVQGHHALPFRFDDVVVKVSKTPAEAKNITMRAVSESFKQIDFGFAFVFPWGEDVAGIDEALTKSTWAGKPLHLDKIFPLDIQHQTGFRLRNNCLVWGKPPPSPVTKDTRKEHSKLFKKSRRDNSKVLVRNPDARKKAKKIEKDWEKMDPKEISKSSDTAREKYFFSVIATRYYPREHKHATSFDLYAYFEQSAIYSKYSEDPTYFQKIGGKDGHQYKHSLLPERSFYMMESTDLRVDNVRQTEKGYPMIIDWGATRVNYDWAEVIFNYLEAIKSRWKPPKDLRFYFPKNLPAPFREMMFLERALSTDESLVKFWYTGDLLVLEDDVYYPWDFEEPPAEEEEPPAEEEEPPPEEEDNDPPQDDDNDDLPTAQKNYKKGSNVAFMKIKQTDKSGAFEIDHYYASGGCKKGPYNVKPFPHKNDNRIILKALVDIKAGDPIRFRRKSMKRALKAKKK